MFSVSTPTKITIMNLPLLYDADALCAPGSSMRGDAFALLRACSPAGEDGKVRILSLVHMIPGVITIYLFL